EEAFQKAFEEIRREHPERFHHRDLIHASLPPVPLNKSSKIGPDDRFPARHAMEDLARKVSKEKIFPMLEMYLATFFSLLKKSVTGDQPSEKELRIILDALNHPLHAVRWDRKNHKLETESPGIRGICQQLVQYLNLIAECGPVHAMCAECGFMFMRQTGDRKFCHDCSKKHQTYKYRKEYLLKKKREYYQRDAQQDREFRNKTNSQKGTMHGKEKRKR